MNEENSMSIHTIFADIYLSLDQSCGPSNQPTDGAIHTVMPLVWLKIETTAFDGVFLCIYCSVNPFSSHRRWQFTAGKCTLLTKLTWPYPVFHLFLEINYSCLYQLYINTLHPLEMVSNIPNLYLMDYNKESHLVDLWLHIWAQNMERLMVTTYLWAQKYI